MTPRTVAFQAPLSMGFSRQEYWRGLPLPTPGDLFNPGIEPASLASPAMAGGFFTSSATWRFWRVVAFELWWWRLLRVPWTARRSNQSMLKEISPGCSLQRLMLKLKLQYFGHLMQTLTHLTRPWCWKRLKEGEGDNRGWDGWMASLTQWTWVWVDSAVGDGQGGLVCCSSWGCKELDKTERLNWTELSTTWKACLKCEEPFLT